MRQKGVLQSWHKNGYGMVSVDEELFFLHRNSIADGEPVIGALVDFDVAPARGNGKFQQAVAAVILTPASDDNITVQFAVRNPLGFNAVVTPRRDAMSNGVLTGGEGK